MRGGCRCFAFLSIFFLSTLPGCGEDRRTGDVPAASDQTATVAPDTATATADTAAGAADTGISSAARSDSTPPPAKPAAEVAQAPPRKPTTAPKPAAPAPKPAPPAPKPAAPVATPEPPAPAAADSPTPAPSTGSDTTPPQTASNAPLRDQYHRAPADTVTQEVYDGWKQYNLNCARCHGEDVLGTTIAPHLIQSLKPSGPINTKELFVQTVCAGRPERGMPAWCPLGMEMDKIQAIYAYVKGRSEGNVGPGRPALKPES